MSASGRDCVKTQSKEMSEKSVRQNAPHSICAWSAMVLSPVKMNCIFAFTQPRHMADYGKYAY
jgi:hypothetical protein